MTHSYELNGLPVKTGDLICTVDGGDTFVAGQFWWLIGKIIPGDVDHIVVYIGPDGRCVEAGAKGVIEFDMPANRWDAAQLLSKRLIDDHLYGIGNPLAGHGFTPSDEDTVRQKVAEYCLAQVGKHYNLNFFKSSTEKAFYCSQLAYLAYLPHGVDLNTNVGVPNIPGTDSIIYPQEVWEGCQEKRPA